MAILGAVVRTLPETLGAVLERLGTQPGVEVSLNPGDGRLVVLIEDCEGAIESAAQTLARITTWSEVVNTSLVYEYSGADVVAPAGVEATDYRAWRNPTVGGANAVEPGRP